MHRKTFNEIKRLEKPTRIKNIRKRNKFYIQHNAKFNCKYMDTWINE